MVGHDSIKLGAQRGGSLRSPRHEDAPTRLANCAHLIADLDAAFATRSLADWAQRFDEREAWWAPVQSILDVIADPRAQPGFVDMTSRAGEGSYRAVATPVDFHGYAVLGGAHGLVEEAEGVGGRGSRIVAKQVGGAGAWS